MMKKDSIALRAYYDTLRHGAERTMLTLRIAEGCRVPRYTVYNWKSGMSRIPELYKDKIEEIAGRKIFERL